MYNARLSPHVSALLDQFIPGYIRENFPELIKFIEVYFEYLENEHASAYYQNTLPQQRDLETQDEMFLSSIESELGLFVPREFESNPRDFYYYVTDLWRSKGTKEAIETFFRLLLNDQIIVRFPWDKVLKPSDGRWVIERKLRVTMISGDGYDFLGKEILQVNNLGVAKVTKVERKVYSDVVIFELSLATNDIAGDFVDRDQIIVFDTDLRAEIYRSVTGLKITNPGTGYQIGDRIRLDQFEGATFVAFVSAVDESGGILSVRMSNFGAGNTPNHIIETNPNDERVYLEDFVLYSYATDQPIASLDDEFQIDTEEGVGADFEIEYGAIATTEGIYTGVRGQLSESIVLQDSDFYQKYSYEVVTAYSIDRWLSSIKKSVHPSGVGVFSNVRILNVLPLGATAETFTDVAIPPNYFFGENVPVTEILDAFVQDYIVGSELYFAETYVGIPAVLPGTTFTNDTQPNLPAEELALESNIQNNDG
jgi:hypothetical protein